MHVSQTPNDDIQISISSPGVKAIVKTFDLKTELERFMAEAKLSLSQPEAGFDLSFVTARQTLDGIIPPVLWLIIFRDDYWIDIAVEIQNFIRAFDPGILLCGQ